MSAAPTADEPSAAAATIAELCSALRDAELAEERLRAVAARAGPGRLEARLASIGRSIERIEAGVGELETEVWWFRLVV